jgi:hypothetical protein
VVATDECAAVRDGRVELEPRSGALVR